MLRAVRTLCVGVLLATAAAGGAGALAGEAAAAPAAVAQDTADAPTATEPRQSEADPEGVTGGLERADGAAELGPGQVEVGSARGELDTTLLQRLQSVLGLAILLLIAWALSTNRRRIPWRVVGWGLSLQLVFALFILRTPAGESIFATLNSVVVELLGYTEDGARFLFGNLVLNNIPVGLGEPGNVPPSGDPGMVANAGAFFAFNVLPTIIFFSSLMAVLYHLGVMQLVVKGVAWVMMRTMRTSGAETLSAAGNIFVGQTEAPLLIKPFVEKMTMSELNAVMVGGFATVAGGVLAAYVGMLVAFFPDIAGHLIAASVMSAPAALVVAKIMVPEEDVPETKDSLSVHVESLDANVIDAAARGAGDGLRLAANVGAMLLAFVALVYMFNGILGWGSDLLGITSALQARGAIPPDSPLTLQALLGWIFAPLAWVMGVPWQDAVQIGSLMGIKTVLNEFFAFLDLSVLLTSGADLSPRSIVIATYALAGFANFSSIAIQIGGIGGIAPSRKSDLAILGLRAMIGGTIAAFLTATVAGMVL
jgi:CNT family concentrative nucleoside transporter